jgi:hypothetical protein
MSEYVDSGILFKNRDKKETKLPDYKGDLTVQCEHCGRQSKRDLAAWIREARNGTKFLTLSFKPKAAAQTHAPLDDGGDIP